ncbi:MAG TPA: NUDIX domain-containing protein [Actinopolymorphaceae bacterium]
MPTIKHATASTFVFHRFPDGVWRTALIKHPRFGRMVIPGGHVESYENPAEAAVREVAEETGLTIELVPPAGVPLPTTFPRAQVMAPWWIFEQPLPGDRGLQQPHVHVDHVYLAVATSPDPTGEPEDQLFWYSADDMPRAEMFDDTRQLADMLFSKMNADVSL